MTSPIWECTWASRLPTTPMPCSQRLPARWSTRRPATFGPTTRLPTSRGHWPQELWWSRRRYMRCTTRNLRLPNFVIPSKLLPRRAAALCSSPVSTGWGNDILPILVSGLAGTIDQIRCQEIFDYTTYEQPDSVRYLIGMGQPMDYEPPMVAPTVPTMVWGGQIRLIARALGVELDEIRETLLRRPLEETVSTEHMGEFAAGTQGALRFEVQGIVGGEPLIVIEHVTRIHPSCSRDWPLPPDGGDGAHKVIVEGRPRIEINVEATDEGGNRAAGGNATAVGRLVNAIPWLRQAEPGLYDALDVPLTPGVGKLGARNSEVLT